MRYSIGLADYLFGEKITLQGLDQKGKVVKCKVSKKWLEQAQGIKNNPASSKAESQVLHN